MKVTFFFILMVFFIFIFSLRLNQAEIKVHSFRSVLAVKVRILIENLLSNRH